MPNIDLIIKTIDHYLKLKNKRFTDPVEISQYLDKKGILRDSSSRPGAPLRKLLRKRQIPHAYQDGVKWQIPISNGSHKRLKPVNKVQKPKSSKPKPIKPNAGHKLTDIAELIVKLLKEKYGNPAEYRLEYKPDWLTSYPSNGIVNKTTYLSDLYAELTDHKLALQDQMELLSERKRRQKQSFDVWFDEPYSFALEFDEKQHFNQFRNITLDYYKTIKVAYPIKLYKELNSNTTINPGKSGFTKLKSNDPLFPELLSGDKQDNRTRQRAFRDFLKDLLPLENGFNPTLRIPYHVTNKKIKDFSQDDLKNIGEYITQYNLI